MSKELGGTPYRRLKLREKSDDEEKPQARAIAVSDGGRRVGTAGKSVAGSVRIHSVNSCVTNWLPSRADTRTLSVTPSLLVSTTATTMFV